MANAFSKGLGGAASGYAIGGPIGAGIGGLIGLLGGNDDVPELGDYKFSPESLKSYNFSDVNLQQMNPELYNKLMQNDQVLHDLQSALAARREGPTANESRQQEQYLNQQASGMASNGMAGTPMGNAMMADAAARLMDQQRERAFQEYQALQGQVANQSNQNLSNYANAQGQVVGQLNQNRQSALMMDQLQNQRQMAQYEEAQKQAAAGNNMWSGLANLGLQGILGQSANGSSPPLEGALNGGFGWLGNQLGFSGEEPANIGGFSPNHVSIPSWNGGAPFPNFYPQAPAASPYSFYHPNPGGQGFGMGMYK